MESAINPMFFVQQAAQQEAQSISSSNVQTPLLTFSRSTSPISFGSRYNNDNYTQVLQFKIQLEGVKKPTVWRRIQIPYDYTFFQFHLAIQCCMGWFNSHMHIFRAQEGFEIGNPHMSEDIPGLPQVREEKTNLLKDYFHNKGQQMEYEYDFGDSWEHTITYEGVFDRKARVRYPKCLRGRGKCPPEDVGGYVGFEGFKEIMSDKNHPEYEEFRKWYGSDFNPDEFNRDSVFDRLKDISDFRDTSDYSF